MGAAKDGNGPYCYHWTRKRYEVAPGVAAPGCFSCYERDIASSLMPGTRGMWPTTRFVLAMTGKVLQHLR